MPSPFVDHPRKRIVREKWNTPILKWLFQKWEQKYLYLGLPGPEVHDIKLWSQMIKEVIAFELTDDTSDNPRENFEKLSANLTLLKLPYTVYHGYLEDVILWKKDLDDKEFSLKSLVTLFNLDFCNSITGKIDTPDGKRCERFETIREIVALQRQLYRTTGTDKFVMLITAFDAFHIGEIKRFISKRDLPIEIKDIVKNEKPIKLTKSSLYKNTEILRLFMFDCLRGYFIGQNIKSFFLPTVKFIGKSSRSPMIHFCVVCIMENLESAQVVNEQDAKEFIDMGMVTAKAGGLIDNVPDPVELLKNSWVNR